MNLLLVALVLLTPPEEGTALASVAVGPDGLAAPGTPYYVAVDLTVPFRPGASDAPEDDCAHGGRPVETFATASAQLEHVLHEIDAFDPSSPSTAPFTPACVATPLTTCHDELGPLACTSMPAYASYDTETGRYYGEVPGSAVRTSTETTVTGTTGVGTSDDCEDCPPPVCC